MSTARRTPPGPRRRRVRTATRADRDGDVLRSRSAATADSVWAPLTIARHAKASTGKGTVRRAAERPSWEANATAAAAIARHSCGGHDAELLRLPPTSVCISASGPFAASSRARAQTLSAPRGSPRSTSTCQMLRVGEPSPSSIRRRNLRRARVNRIAAGSLQPTPPLPDTGAPSISVRYSNARERTSSAISTAIAGRYTGPSPAIGGPARSCGALLGTADGSGRSHGDDDPLGDRPEIRDRLDRAPLEQADERLLDDVVGVVAATPAQNLRSADIAGESSPAQPVPAVNVNHIVRRTNDPPANRPTWETESHRRWVRAAHLQVDVADVEAAAGPVAQRLPRAYQGSGTWPEVPLSRFVRETRRVGPGR